MISRRFLSVVTSLAVCSMAHANTLPAGVASVSNATDLHLLACHATLAVLTILGMTLSLRRWPWSAGRQNAVRTN